MGISFILLVNKQGQTRLANYTDSSIDVGDRKALEGEIVRRCLARSEKQARPLEGLAAPRPPPCRAFLVCPSSDTLGVPRSAHSSSTGITK